MGGIVPKVLNGKQDAKKRDVMRRLRLANDLLSTLTERAKLGGSPDRRRNLNDECGYPTTVSFDDCWEQFTRNGVAARVNNIYPDECFAVDPVAYESESARSTPFEASWEDLLESYDSNPLHYAHRLDVVSGIGRYGGMLIGVNDGKSLDSPLEGAEDRDGNLPRRELQLNYLRVFDERRAKIRTLKNDPRSHRHGKPEFYDVELITDEGLANNTKKTEFVKVHWSRMIHAADNRMGSEFFGIPRMQQVFNRLLDVEKVLGPGAEMFYKGGFPGLSIEMDPRIAEIMDIDIEEDSIDEEMYRYMNGLQRYLWLEGLNAKSLAPQVANPGPTLEALLSTIAMAGGYPVRIFMGSEQAQLASGQDVRTWNRRLKRRQEKYLTPCLIRPLIDRLIKVGVVRPPRRFNKQAGVWSFKVWWPDINMPSTDEQSQIADRRAAAMMKYMQSMSYQVMQFSDFLRHVMGYTERETAAIMKNSKRPPELDIKPPQPAGDSGVGGKPPSKANPKPRPGGKSKP